MWQLVRFFRVVAPVPSLMVVTFIAVTIASVAAVLMDVAYAAGTLQAVMVLQLFAASSGFAGNARRGYYDLLLTRGDGRAVIALVQWAMSIAPGVGSWIVVACSDVIARGGGPGAGFASGTCAAMFVVSTAPWAFTASLPRFSAAIGWVVVFTMGVAMYPAIRAPAAIRNLVYPLGMIGQNVGADPIVAMPAICVSAISIAVALLWIERTAVPLEASQ